MKTLIFLSALFTSIVFIEIIQVPVTSAAGTATVTITVQIERPAETKSEIKKSIVADFATLISKTLKSFGFVNIIKASPTESYA